MTSPFVHSHLVNNPLLSGTGLICQFLHEKGYKNFDALDPSEEMLAMAKSRNIFTNFYQSFVGGGAQLPYKKVGRGVDRQTYTQIDALTRTHRHTHRRAIHTQTHTDSHRDTLTHTDTNTHTHTHIHTYINTLTHKHTYIHTYTQT